MKDERKEGSPGRTGLFPETAWTLLLEPIRKRSPDAQAALEELCERYRRPLVALASYKVRDPQDAEDITHDFLLSLLRRDALQRLDRNRGKFRSFLRVSLSNYIESWRRSDRRSVQVPLDETSEAVLSEDEELTQQFNREWAATILRHATAAVEAWYVKRDKQDWFVQLANLLPGAAQPATQPEVSIRLGLSTNQVCVEYHRFRERVERAILKEIASTVATPDEAGGELEALKRYLGGAPR